MKFPSAMAPCVGMPTDSGVRTARNFFTESLIKLSLMLTSQQWWNNGPKVENYPGTFDSLSLGPNVLSHPRTN